MMLLLGWWLMPVHISTYFEPTIYGRIHDHFHLWIWMYRFHLFGMIVTVIAYVALAALVANSESRVLIWPGAAVASSGMIVGALGAAFYYHHGAWGALELNGKTQEDARAFTEALRVDTEYITCLVRFGRVFGGLGLLVMAWGALRFRILPTWSGYAAAIIGVGAMALTMGLPTHLEYYLPIFHAQVLWLFATGVGLVRQGVVSPPFAVEVQYAGR